MVKEEIIDDILDFSLDCIDEGENITDDHLNTLNENKDASLNCQELLQLKAAMRFFDNKPDIEAQLARLHKRLDKNEKHSKTTHFIALILTAAAVFAGFMIYINVGNNTQNNEIFTASNNAGPVTISSDKGQTKTIKAIGTHSYTISIADYRKAITDNKQADKVLVNVPDGKTALVDLPDGSVVYLHPGSRLKFPTTFIGDKRYVMLEGEAYFKVHKDKTKPFIVQTGDIVTTVLGTEFNVKNNTITLVTGSVRVANNNTKQSLVITPGQQVSMIDNQLKVANVDTLQYVYWRDGYLYYDNMTIGDVMKNIGLTYNMTVKCNNSAVLNQRLRFIAERDKGIDTTLEMMNRMGKVRVMRKGNTILVD